MRHLKAAIKGALLGSIISLCVLFCISLVGTRLIPHHIGVDPKLRPYLNEWIGLARDHNITFDRSVSIGFSNINSSTDHFIGLTNYGVFFREIDIDRQFWEKASAESKRMLLWHELGHAYCDRRHDYGIGKEYADDGRADKDGFFVDDCPISLMFPTIIDDSCFMAHYQEYVDEMFQRCIPY